MNLRWSGTFRRFEAEFSDFQGDLAAVKAAGFKPDTSSGAWVWWTAKSAVLTNSEITSPPVASQSPREAREQYTALAAIDEKNAEVRAALKNIKKSRRKPHPKTRCPRRDISMRPTSRPRLP